MHSDVRKRYVLTFPRDLEYEQVLAFVRSLAGLPHAKKFGSLATIAFEVQADVTGIKHYLSIPVHLADYVISQARGQIPGIRVEMAEDPRTYWSAVTELSLSSVNMPLKIASAESAINTVLASLLPLKENEAILMQWVIGPAQKEAAHEGDKLYQVKHGDHTFLAVGRLAARAETKDDAKKLVRRIYTGLSAMKAYGVSFGSRAVPATVVHKRIIRQSSVLTYPCVFNAPELSVLIAFPATKSPVPGLPQGQSRHLAADPSIPSDGFVLGQSNFPGAERPLGIKPEDLLRHMWVGGPTGVGKSTTLHNLAQQIMTQGYGMIVLEPKGDLINDILATVPFDRQKDVILFDPSDSHYPIGLNILADTDEERITGHIVALFKSIYGDSWGPRLEYILRYSVLTAALLGLSLYDVKQLLLNPSFRRSMIRKTKHPEVRDFWRWFEQTSDNASDSVINKLDTFLGYSVIRNIVGQRTSSFSMSEALKEGKIILMPLSSGLVGDSNAAMLGSLLVALAWQAARGRAGIPQTQRNPYFMILDEFQNFMNLPLAIGDALAQARGYGLGMILANQHLAQLKTEVRAGVMANTSSKIIYRLNSAEDARAMQGELNPYVTSADLQTLGQYEAVVRLSDAPPATAYMSAPPQRTGAPQDIRELSRATYARPVSEVEAEFHDRYYTEPESVSRPSIGAEQ